MYLRYNHLAMLKHCIFVLISFLSKYMTGLEINSSNGSKCCLIFYQVHQDISGRIHQTIYEQKITGDPNH
jgi:hypothetical protein